MESQKSKKNIAILTESSNAATETFVRNHILYIPHNNFLVYGSPYPYIYHQERKWNFIEKVSFRIRKRLHKKNWDQFYKEEELTKILTQKKIQIVFAEFLTIGAQVVEVCQKLKIPIIVTALGYDISINEIIEKNKRSYQKLFEYCSYVIIVSQHMRKSVKALGCNSTKIIYSPAGPDETFFHIKPHFEKNNIFALGRFVEKKAPHLTILAFHKVLKEIPDAFLFFGGNGPLLGVAKDLSKALKIEKSIVFLDNITQDEQKKILEQSAVFVQHSKTAYNGDSEGTPVAILEASAASLPVVATYHAGIPDVIIDAETGYLVNEYDVDGMAERIIRILKNKTEGQSMGYKGKVFVQENFSLSKHIEIINELILKNV